MEDILNDSPKNNEGKKSFNIHSAFFVILLPLILLAMVESISRGGISAFIDWAKQYKDEFFVNYCMVFGIINIFYILKRKAYLAIYFIMLAVLSVAGYVNRVKTELRGEPLLPWDLKLGKEASDISAYLGDYLNFKVIIVAIAIVAVAFLVVYFVPKQKYQKRNSIGLGILCLLLSIIVFTDKPYALKEKHEITTITWDQGMHFNQNGFLLGFMLDAKWLKVQKPEGYSKEAVEAAFKKENFAAGNNEGDEKSTKQSKKPNVIFIMSEAFWDPTVMKDLKFSKDPVPYFHSLQKEFTTGTMTSPVFGGGTVNTEFEALSGYSTEFLPSGAIAYAQYVHKPIDSMVRVMSDNGYKTTAIHTYHNWFYGRDKVYENLGFDRFIGMEFFSNPKHVGEFIADSEIANRIVNEVKESKEPDFIYAVTMQNHGPYPENKNPKNTITVEGNLSPSAKQMIETYSQTVSDADKALKQVIEGIQKSGEPTVVVFYGDHLPMLGQNYQVYKEANYFSDSYTYDGYKKMYGVPFVIWNNFGAKKEELHLTPNFYVPYVLNMIEQKGNAFTDYLYGLFKSGITVIPKENYYKDAGVDPAKLEAYKLFQYDLLFGDNYLLNHKYTDKDKKMTFGSGPITIKGTNPKVIKVGEVFNEWQGESVLGIEGDNFVAGSRLLVNGETVAANFKDEHYMTAILPKKYYDKPGTLEITVEVPDSLNNVLAKSNIYQVKIQ